MVGELEFVKPNTLIAFELNFKIWNFCWSEPSISCSSRYKHDYVKEGLWKTSSFYQIDRLLEDLRSRIRPKMQRSGKRFKKIINKETEDNSKVRFNFNITIILKKGLSDLHPFSILSSPFSRTFYCEMCGVLNWIKNRTLEFYTKIHVDSNPW